MFIVIYLMGSKIKCYSLMMNLARRFKIQNGMVISLNPSRENCCQKIKCNGWTCHFVYGYLDWIANGKDNSSSSWHYMERYFKLCLSFTSQHYFWFLQYMNNDNADVHNTQPPLGVYPKMFNLFSMSIFPCCSFIMFSLVVMIFICSLIRLFFTNYATLFVTLKGRKRCWPLCTITHFWFYNQLIKRLLFFFTIIVTTSSS